MTISPDMTLAELAELVKKNGFAGYPVIDENQNLVGIITGRDTRFVTDLSKTVREFMTPKDRLVTVKENASREEIFHLMHEHRVEKVLVVNNEFQLKGMITLKDYQKRKANRMPVKMSLGVCVWGGSGAGPGNEERIDVLVKSGCRCAINRLFARAF